MMPENLKGPRSSMISKAAKFPMTQKKYVDVPGIYFLLGVNYVNFMDQNSAQDLFTLQRSCTYPFSPLSSARQFACT